MGKKPLWGIYFRRNQEGRGHGSSMTTPRCAMIRFIVRQYWLQICGAYKIARPTFVCVLCIRSAPLYILFFRTLHWLRESLVRLNSPHLICVDVGTRRYPHCVFPARSAGYSEVTKIWTTRPDLARPAHQLSKGTIFWTRISGPDWYKLNERGWVKMHHPSRGVLGCVCGFSPPAVFIMILKNFPLYDPFFFFFCRPPLPPR